MGGSGRPPRPPAPRPGGAAALRQRLNIPPVSHGWYVVGCAFLLAVWGWGLGFYALGVYLVGAGLIALLGRAIARFGQLSLAFVVMAVGWSTMSSAVLNILVAPWFDRQQGLALSLAFTGASMGGVVVGPAVLWLVGVLGFTTGVRVAVVAMLVILVPVVAVVVRRQPQGAAAANEVRADGETPRSRPLRTLAYR